MTIWPEVEIIVLIGIIAWLPGVAAIWGAAANTFGAVLASGFIAGGIRTGTFKGAVEGAFDARARFNGVGGGFSTQACFSCVSNLVGGGSRPNEGNAIWYNVLRVLVKISTSGTSSGDADNRANGADLGAYRETLNKKAHDSKKDVLVEPITPRYEGNSEYRTVKGAGNGVDDSLDDLIRGIEGT